MSLEKAITTILKVCMDLKDNESFLVVYDKNKKNIADLILRKAKTITKKADRIKTMVAKVNGDEPPKNIAEKMKNYDVIVIATTKSLSHTIARRNASKEGARIASMPGITEDVLKRTLTADYNRIKKINKKLLNALKKGKEIVLTTKKGTNLTVYSNQPSDDNGFYHRKGDFGNLPAGEVGFAPKERKTNGILVIDKTMAGIGKLKNDIKIEIKNGFAKKIYGNKEANMLNNLLKKQKDKSVYNIAEFAIGTNYKAKITGITLEDEKVYGTAHVALGDNMSYKGGKTKAPVHLDGVISNPTIFVNNKKIMNNGKLLL